MVCTEHCLSNSLGREWWPYVIDLLPECIRDLDPNLEKECKALGYTGKYKEHARWCYTMSGREFGRMPSWGSGPKRAVSSRWDVSKPTRAVAHVCCCRAISNSAAPANIWSSRKHFWNPFSFDTLLRMASRVALARGLSSLKMISKKKRL